MAEEMFDHDEFENAYIGLTSLNSTDGSYTWIDGSPLNYTNWMKG